MYKLYIFSCGSFILLRVRPLASLTCPALKCMNCVVNTLSVILGHSLETLDVDLICAGQYSISTKLEAVKFLDCLSSERHDKLRRVLTIV